MLTKIPTGIAGLDAITDGGLPEGRTTLVVGSAGSGKTVLAAQFLLHGIERGEPALFVTFEEEPDSISDNLSSFGWDMAGHRESGALSYIHAGAQPGVEQVVVGPYDFSALMSRIESAIRRTGVKRVVLDSIGAVFTDYTERTIIRRELQRLAHAVAKMGVTALITSERDEEYGAISRFGVEQFVADDVIILRNVLEREQVRRTIQVLKFRGTTHRKGEFPFTISPDAGVVVLPVTGRTRSESSSDERTVSGNPVLDEMCGGGFLRDSVILVSGATGTGKTLTSTAFLNAGAAAGQRSLLFGYEESREQLFRNARGWGYDFEALEREGSLKVICEYPEVQSLEDHLLVMRTAIHEYQPTRVAIDSLSALENISSMRSFRQFMMGITAVLKERQITGLMTATTPSLLGGESITVSHISTLTDSIILLRYVELYGEVKRGMTVLKMRGSTHEKHIREIEIDGEGMHILEPFRTVEGILGGTPLRSRDDEQRLRNLFNEQ